MNRREFLQCAALIVGGASAAQMGWSLTREQRVYLANAPDFIDTKVNYFSGEHRNIVAAIADIIIPRTDTPGALDAGVPTFIELMVAQWFNDGERKIFDNGLNDIEKRIPVSHGSAFYRLSKHDQLGLLQELEQKASDSPWYQFGNTYRDFISDAPFICQIKELTIWGFFTSEVGGTRVLRYKAMPMRFDGDIELSADDSSWMF